MTGGIKNDTGKPRMDLLPWDALIPVARVLTSGASKYGEHNWRGGFAWSRLSAAALRHLAAWITGHDTDDETGESHLAHAACCILFLLAHTVHGYGIDDRYKEQKNDRD